MARLVRRYGNRKLYDTSASRYVSIEEVGRFVKAGEDVQVLENDTGKDLTAVTFAQIILEEERRKRARLPLGAFRELIQHGQDAFQGIAETVDRGMGALRTAPERAGRRVQALLGVNARLVALQKGMDEVIRRSLDAVTSQPAFQAEVRRLKRTLQALEARIGRLRAHHGSVPESPSNDQQG